MKTSTVGIVTRMNASNPLLWIEKCICICSFILPFLERFLGKSNNRQRWAQQRFADIEAGRQLECRIIDFGNACWTYKQFTQDIQTRQYRCPEVGEPEKLEGLQSVYMHTHVFNPCAYVCIYSSAKMRQFLQSGTANVTLSTVIHTWHAGHLGRQVLDVGRYVECCVYAV